MNKYQRQKSWCQKREDFLAKEEPNRLEAWLKW
jgi:hypothetical protein